jgi:hypothetical protein
MLKKGGWAGGRNKGRQKDKGKKRIERERRKFRHLNISKLGSDRSAGNCSQ